MSTASAALLTAALLGIVWGIAGCADQSPPPQPLQGSSADPGTRTGNAMSAGGTGGPVAAAPVTGAGTATGVGAMPATTPTAPAAPTPPAPNPPAGSPPAPGAGGAAAPAAMDPAACDRACLSGILDAYFAALAAKDPAGVKTSASLKFTENGEPIELGEGLWQSGAKLRADTRMDFVDPQEGQVGSQTVLDDAQSMPVIFQVRLKVVAQEITEVETMVVRQADAANGFFSVEGMKPQPVFKQQVDPEKRMTREQMKVQVDRYFDALDSGDWNRAMTQFDDSCARYENGQATATSASQIRGQRFMFDVVRRYLIFDEEMGLTWGMFPFSQTDNTLVVGELFKVMDEKIMMIQAVMGYMPSKAWD